MKALVIGGPYDGKFVTWTSGLVEPAPGIFYHRWALSLGDTEEAVYVLEDFRENPIELLMQAYANLDRD